MMKFDLDDNDYLVEFTYTVKDTKHTIVLDCVEAEKKLNELGEAFHQGGASLEALKAFDADWRAYLEAHGGTDIPEALLYQMVGYVPMAVDEFKKKLPEPVQSHLSMASTPSTFDQLKEGHLKLASTPSEQSENLSNAASPPTLPASG